LDYSSIIVQLFKGLWFLPVLAIGVAVLSSPWLKGMVGEFLVNLTIRLRLSKHDYRLCKDVTLPTEDGTTQIDHIIVSIYGIFVVETKNMRGWIFGSANQKMWTQKIYKHTHKFQNPLHQNYKHTKTLESILELPSESIRSVIVFAGDSTFKTQMPPNVTDAGSFIRHIKSFNSPVLTPAQVDRVWKQIDNKRLERGLKTDRQHVRHLAQKHSVHTASEVKPVASPKDTETPACPKCGSATIQRTAKQGPNKGKTFWGCSTFPRCRGVIKPPQAIEEINE